MNLRIGLPDNPGLTCRVRELVQASFSVSQATA